jgi:peptidoglycan/xylan/chitin deacetylase (PgdA/CDA1 family)
MAGRSKKLIRAGLEALYFTGAYRALQPFFGGLGAILTLHHVRPAREETFQPNRLLEVTPDFLESTIMRLRRAGIDLVSLDDMLARLESGVPGGRRFACLTFDDGYRDNLDYAWPILKRHGVPFGLYVAANFPEGLGELWWVALERVVAGNDAVTLVRDGAERRFETRRPAEKEAAHAAIYWWLRGRPTEDALRDAVRDLCRRHGVDIGGLPRELCMTWQELASLAAEPLCTIGAHTVDHVLLGKVSEATARTEMLDGAEIIEQRLGLRPRHLSYPVGDASAAGPREFRLAAELGFATGVTTRPGVLFAEHALQPTALPRISLNGEFQRLRYLDVLLSGAPSALWNKFQRVNPPPHEGRPTAA